MKRSAAIWLAVPAVALAASRAPPHAPATTSGTCPATTVQYTATRRGLPHVDVPGARGDLVYYTGSTLMDGRVNTSGGLVAYAGRRARINWTIRHGAGTVLSITGRRLDGHGTLAERWGGVRGSFTSRIAIPDGGCWELTLRSGSALARVVVRAVEPPAAARCEPTPVYRDAPPHPRFGAITWMPAAPRSAGVAAVLFVTVVPGQDRAVIPAGGKFPGSGPNTKFLWWAPRPGPLLTLTGKRLDARGAFHGVFGSASGGVGHSGPQVIFPSYVVAPAAGCWSVVVRTGRSAGLVVFRVVPRG